MEKKKKALYTKKSISYGLVNGISSLKTNTTGTYLSFFLTTFVGLTNVQLGTMNTVKGLIGLWGSFVIVVIMQKVRLPWGRYRSWIYIMMPLAGIFQILTFVNWGNLPEGIKFPLVFVICVLDTFLYNFAFAAYTGLMIPLPPTRRSVPALPAHAARSIPSEKYSSALLPLQPLPLSASSSITKQLAIPASWCLL